MADKREPLQVLYCAVCSMPGEYCEFGPDFEKCKPWLLANVPELYPDLVKETEKAAEQLEDLSIDGHKKGDSKIDGAAGSSSASKEEDAKTLPGGKTKKKGKPEVVIEKIVRNKRKCVTIVKGLDLFGIKLGEASKKFGKKFATGASVVKGPTEKEQIDVQGDVVYDMVDFILETWKSVPGSSVFLIEDGKKVAAS